MKCEVCGKAFKTRSGLRRHVKSVHGDKAPGEVGPTVAVPIEETLVPDDLVSKPMREACKALGIKVKDVMAFKVYDDKVVIIEGPTGWKRVWKRE